MAEIPSRAWRKFPGSPKASPGATMPRRLPCSPAENSCIPPTGAMMRKHRNRIMAPVGGIQEFSAGEHGNLRGIVAPGEAFGEPGNFLQALEGISAIAGEDRDGASQF